METFDADIKWECIVCGNIIGVTPHWGLNNYFCSGCGKWYHFLVEKPDRRGTLPPITTNTFTPEERNSDMAKKLEVTKEKVLEAAKGCPTAKGVLKTLFPEAFKDEFEPRKAKVGHFYRRGGRVYMLCGLWSGRKVLIDETGQSWGKSDECLLTVFMDTNWVEVKLEPGWNWRWPE